MSSTLTRLAGMQDVLRQGAESPLPPADAEAQSIYNVTPRPARASIPLGRRLSRKSITSLKSTVTSPGEDEDIPPLPPTPRTPGFGGVAYSATKTSLNPPLPQQQPAAQQGTWAGHSNRQQQQEQQVGHQAAQLVGGGGGGNGTGEEMAWGPSHPCFPHTNPHVPASSPEHESTRVIRVRRDFLAAGDGYPQLQNVYPEILAEWLSETGFRSLVDGINARLRDSFRPDSARAVLDAVAGVLTGFVWEDLGLTGAKSGVRDLEAWMESWNVDRERERNEIRLVPLRRTGFANLDIVIPDPGIDVIEAEEPGAVAAATAGEGQRVPGADEDGEAALARSEVQSEA